MIYLNLKRLAELFYITQPAAFKWIKENSMPKPMSVKVGGHIRKIWAWEEVADFLRENRKPLGEPEPMPPKVSIEAACELFGVKKPSLERIADFPKEHGGFYEWSEIERWIEKHAEAE